MCHYYFRTCCILAPNNAPGFDVGTRRSDTSPGTNLNIIFNVIVSDNFNDLFIGESRSHCRLNFNY